MVDIGTRKEACRSERWTKRIARATPGRRSLTRRSVLSSQRGSRLHGYAAALAEAPINEVRSLRRVIERRSMLQSAVYHRVLCTTKNLVPRRQSRYSCAPPLAILCEMKLTIVAALLA